jgi:hypothetical protein
VGGDRARRIGAPGHFTTEEIMETMLSPRIYELAVEIEASLQRIHGMLALLGAFDAREDFHSARDLRMSEEEIRRIMARTRIIVTAAPPDAAEWINARVDQIEAKLDLAHWLESACEQTRALAAEFVRLMQEAMADCEAYATENFYALKRASREPGNEHLIPHVQEMQRSLRNIRTKKR